MIMKKLSFIAMALCVSFVSCTKEDVMDETASVNALKKSTNGSPTSRTTATEPGTTCTATTVTLFAGKTIDAGTVTIINDADSIYVTYSTANGFYLTAAHLYVGATEVIPVNKAGNPIPGHFPYNVVLNKQTEYTVAVPISALPMGVCGSVAAHCVVERVSGGSTQRESAWGNGTVINPTGQWGMRVDYCSCIF